MAEVERRAHRGRGRISSMEMMPEAADEALAFANTELRLRRMPQTAILRRMNAMLADHGIRPVSVGTFSRYSLRMAMEIRKITASREITNAVINRLPKGDRSETTVAAIELVKHRLIELILGKDDPDPQLLASASLALMRLSTTALVEAKGQFLDQQDKREQVEREKAHDRELAAAAKAATKIAKEAGLSADRITAIRKGVLGLTK
jgi:hypothetical protein